MAISRRYAAEITMKDDSRRIWCFDLNSTLKTMVNHIII
jgi:hypothetical protein